MTEVLRVNGVSKFYKGKRNGSRCIIKAVDDVSFSVSTGEVVGFLGPNGAGKSTTIKIIAGMAAATSGTISVSGFDISKEREKAMRYVGGVIESPDLYKDWSGRKNLLYLASLHPRDTMEKQPSSLTKRQLDEQRCEAVLELVGLRDRADSLVKAYSLGMKQRLGIAQALLSQPKLLILDEPANGLDPAGIKEIRDLLRTLAHEHDMAVLVSSHILSEMQLMCDRVLIIDNGKIMSEKKLEELNETQVGTKTVCVSTDAAEKAAELLRAEFGVSCVLTESGVEVVTDKEVSDITRALVLGGINVFGVHIKERTLEDVFMTVTTHKAPTTADSNGGNANV